MHKVKKSMNKNLLFATSADAAANFTTVMVIMGLLEFHEVHPNKQINTYSEMFQCAYTKCKYS